MERKHVLEKEGEMRHKKREGKREREGGREGKREGGRERGGERELQIPVDTKDPGDSNILSKSDEQ